MKNIENASTTVVLTVVITIGLVMSISAGATYGQQNNTSVDSDQLISVKQIDAEGNIEGCVETRALGDGTQTVKEFYGYVGSPDLSAARSRRIQLSDVSQIIFYNGSDGMSLIILHDRYADGTAGGNANMTFTGLPADGEWTIRDDGENAPFSADSFEIFNRSTTIRWRWSTNRTDGAAFRGISPENYDEVRINPDFNRSETNINTWGLRISNSNKLLELNMAQTVAFSPGPCPENITPTPTPTATPEISGIGLNDTPTVSAPTETVETDVETNIGNNSTRPLASLEISNIEVDTQEPAAEEPVQITATIRNPNAERVRGEITFRTADGSTEQRVVSLGPDQEQIVQFEYVYNQPGTYTIRGGDASAQVNVGPSSEQGAGFGVGTALVGILTAALLVRLRQSGTPS